MQYGDQRAREHADGLSSLDQAAGLQYRYQAEVYVLSGKRKTWGWRGRASRFRNPFREGLAAYLAWRDTL